MDLEYITSKSTIISSEKWWLARNLWTMKKPVLIIQAFDNIIFKNKQKCEIIFDILNDIANKTSDNYFYLPLSLCGVQLMLEAKMKRMPDESLEEVSTENKKYCMKILLVW